MFSKYSVSIYETKNQSGLKFAYLELLEKTRSKKIPYKILDKRIIYSKEEGFEFIEDISHLFKPEEIEELESNMLDLDLIEYKYKIGRDHDHNVSRTHRTKESKKYE